VRKKQQIIANSPEANWLALADSFEYKLFKDEETQA
jgi:hypothetical protein